MDSGPHAIMERFVLQVPGIMGGQHMDFFFLKVLVKKIDNEFKQVRDVLPVITMVDGIEEIIEFSQQTPVLLVEVWKASIPLRIPYELAHGASPGMANHR